MTPSPTTDRRQRLAHARLQLLFTPAAVPEGRDPLQVLQSALPHVGIVQVRVKPLGDPRARTEAAATERWTRAVLELVQALDAPPLVIVNDRVDVAVALREEGVDGVHLGQDDLAPRHARELLGPDLLIGLSTHDAADLVRATDEPVDSLGFGPVYATATKGYTEAKGPEAAWVAASSAAPRPLFPIGGIDTTNVSELAQVGRAAVSSAILAAPDPAAAARELGRCLLEGEVAAEGP